MVFLVWQLESNYFWLVKSNYFWLVYRLVKSNYFWLKVGTSVSAVSTKMSMSDNTEIVISSFPKFVDKTRSFWKYKIHTILRPENTIFTSEQTDKNVEFSLRDKNVSLTYSSASFRLTNFCWHGTCVVEKFFSAPSYVFSGSIIMAHSKSNYFLARI